MKILLTLLFSLLLQSAFCVEKAWWAGSILTSTPVPAGVGVVACEPYLFFFADYGTYNRKWKLKEKQPIYSINPFLEWATGLTDHVSIRFIAQYFFKWRKGKETSGFGDSAVELLYGFCDERASVPAMGIAVNEWLPTGKYHNLDPDLGDADVTGTGSFLTNVSFRAQKNILLSNKKWLRWRLNVIYLMTTPVSIKGFSVYGGGFGARGTVYPGNSITTIGSLEYQITQNWVISCDFTYTHVNKSTFSGYPGVTKAGDTSSVGLSSSEDVTVAPAIEYNIDSKVGIIVGIWATCFGRNAPAFLSPVVAVNMVF